MNHAVRALALAAIPLACCLAGACGGTAVDCGQLRCPDPLLISGKLTYLSGEPVHLRVRLCRDAKCSEGEVQAPALGKSDSALQGDLPATASLASGAATAPWELSVRIRDQQGQDGDLVTLRLTTVPGGTVIFEETTAPVTYLLSHPNGPECSPTCRSAVLSFD